MPEFKSYAQLLRADSAPAQTDGAEEARAPTASNHLELPVLDLPELGRDVRLFRAHLREMLEHAVLDLRAQIARDIVARELQISPVEIAQLVERALEEYHRDEPVRLRAHPADLSRMEVNELPVYSDEGLRAGEVVLELRSGKVDLRMQARLDSLFNAER